MNPFRSFRLHALLLVLLASAVSARAELILVHDEQQGGPVFRANTETGEAFSMEVPTRGSTVRWRKFDEVGRLGKSTYAFLAVTRGGATNLMRIDKLTGESWITSGRRWVKVLEQ